MDHSPEELLWGAAYSGDVTKIINYLNQGVDIDSYLEDYGGEETALLIAVKQENVEAVKFLLDRGANMMLRTDYGDTAFHLAALKGDLNMIKMFVEHGVDLDVTGEEDYTALHYAISFDHADIIFYLINQGASLDMKESLCGKTARERLKDKGITVD